MDIDKYIDQPDRKCWELWGEDRFSGETYFCGLYASNPSANRARRRHVREVAEYQSEGLYDQFWLVPTTVGRHIKMLQDRDERRQLTWDMIARHKAIIDEVWDQFRLLAYKNGDKPGEHSIFFMISHPECEITKISITNYKEAARKKGKEDNYYLSVSIKFKGVWTAARSVGTSILMRGGTLAANGKYAREEMFFEHARENIFKAIEKYFYGE